MKGRSGQRSKTLGSDLTRVKPSRKGLLVLLVAGVAVLVFALAYFARVSYAGSDPQLSLLVSQAILEQGTIRLDAYMDLPGFDLGPWIVENSNGHVYYYWPIGPSILSVPYVWLLNQFGLDMAVVQDNNWAQNLLSAILCTLIFVLLYRLCRQYLARWPSLLIATLSVLGTGLISTMGTALWNINFAVLFIVLLLLQLAQLDQEGAKAANPYWMGFLLFAAFFCRPSTSVFILLVLVYLLLKDRGLFLRTAATALVLLAIYIGLFWLEYGQPFQEYYSVVRVGIYSFDLPTVLYGLFLSPSRGLLVFSPFLTLVAAAALCCFQGIRRSPLFWLALAWFGLHTAMVSRSTRWWGGHSFGPRVLTEVLPALIVLTILLWRNLTGGSNQRLRYAVAAAYLILGLAAVFINSYQGLYNVSTQRWNGFQFAPNIDRHPRYLLDWQNPQFLATSNSLCDRNQEHLLRELRAGAFDLDQLRIGEEITYLSGMDKTPPAASGRGSPWTDPLGEAAQPKHRPYSLFLPAIVDSRENAVFVGWSKADTAYRWSECRDAQIIFELEDLDAAGRRYQLEVSAGSYGPQRTVVFLNGNRIGDLAFPGPRDVATVERVSFDGSLLEPGELNEIRFSLPDAREPSRGDPRLLGLAFFSLRLGTADDESP
jgi:hypothetical protein